jgi:hypothetical protein
VAGRSHPDGVDCPKGGSPDEQQPKLIYRGKLDPARQWRFARQNKHNCLVSFSGLHGGRILPQAAIGNFRRQDAAAKQKLGISCGNGERLEALLFLAKFAKEIRESDLMGS